MNISFRIAKRYLFSKKSHNAINIISGISAGGVTVGTMALVCVLSAFNGFGTIFEGLFSSFDPDLKISLVEGKSFSTTDSTIQAVKNMPEVAYFTEVLQENAMLRYREKQAPGTIKGVSEDFQQMTKIDSVIIDGNFLLKDKAFNYGVAGLGLAASMGFAPYFNDPLYIYAPRRTERVNLSNPENSFTLDHVFISSVFSVQQVDYDSKIVLIPIDLARELFQYPTDAATSIELKIDEEVDKSLIQKNIKSTLGDGFKVQNRHEQQEDYFRIMKIEKWITYLILSFILLIAIFNIIGSLSMLIIDKKDDIKILRNMGAPLALVRRIFLYEGWLISILGALLGIAIGTSLCLLQQHFGFISLPGGNEYIVNAYPVKIEVLDLILVFTTVSVMGFFAAYYPVRQIKNKN